ncbi:MAG TPA: MCP four helix bundle domain-containing protein [Thiobacillaceae bacterium]|nr:MCP four helix bundle domain-containing protein [Thiobacillaceae bacterium]HNU65472.1 MCP four helix bundle domain-containing protein [Thiobacillaceae bacterium]
MRTQLIAISATLSFLAFGSVQAAPADDACAALMEARTHLVSMIGSSDKAVNDGLKARIHEASARVDATLSSMSGSDAAKAAAFKPVWEDFKKTRETEIIPLVYAGKNAEAKAIATGIQAERMGKMKAAMGCK